MEQTINKQDAFQVSFITYLNQEILRLRQRRCFGQALRIESARNSFSHFLCSQGLDDLCLDALTTSVVCAYQQWLTDSGIKKNSTSCYMRTLQSVYNRVAAQTDNPESPFSKVYRGIAKTRKRATSIAVMQRVKQLNIRQGLISIGKSPQRKNFPVLLRKLTFARDLFIFCYCARGMAFVDVAYLRKKDIQKGIIRYRRRKTGQLIEVAIEPLMQEIIDRYAMLTKGSPYVFPILPQADEETTYRAYRTALRTYNNKLKQLSHILGNEVNLSSYVARHSWASNMHEMNIPLSIISQGLGHNSELTTQIYIKSLENNAVHHANRKFINQIFSNPFLPHERDSSMANCHNQNLLRSSEKWKSDTFHRIDRADDDFYGSFKT